MSDRQQHAFTLELRERFLALVTVGKSVEEAAAVVGISRTTIARWAARGRVPDATTEHSWFAQRLDAIRTAKAEDVAQHREEPDAAEDPPEHPYRSLIYERVRGGDPFVWLSPDEMAELTEEQRQRARQAHIAEVDARSLHLQPENWQEKRALILSGTWDVAPAEERPRWAS
jgi:hypothetical protein